MRSLSARILRLRWALLMLLVGLKAARATEVEHDGQRLERGERSDLPSGEAQPRALLVVCEPTGLSAGVRRELRSFVSAELRELKVGVRWAPPLAFGGLEQVAEEAGLLARRERADAVVWFETTERGWLIFLYEPRGPQLRRRAISAQSSSSAIEEVTVVLRSALTAIVEGLEAGMSEVELPSKQPAQPEPPREEAEQGPKEVPRSSEALLSAGVAYSGALYAGQAPWQNGGMVQLSWRPWRGGVYLGASHTWFAPLDVTRRATGAELQTRIRRQPTELSLGSELSSGALRWGPEWGLVADRIERSTTLAEEPFFVAERSRRWQWAMSARIRGTWLWKPDVGISSSVGADFLPQRLHHVAETEEGSIPLLRQMPVRPRLEIGAFVRLW